MQGSGVLKTLNNIKLDKKFIIKEINIDGNLKNRLLDLGFIKGNEITCIYESPSKNPRAYKILNSVIALRNEDAKNILVEGDKYGFNK